MATYMLMRLELASGAQFGPGRAALLEGIERFGSISASARAVGLSYRQAWDTVQVMNEMFGEPLVIVGPGRATGAKLTPFGRKVVAKFREIEDMANKTLARQLKAFDRLVGEDPDAPVAAPRWVQIKDPANSDDEPKRRR